MQRPAKFVSNHDFWLFVGYSYLRCCVSVPGPHAGTSSAQLSSHLICVTGSHTWLSSTQFGEKKCNLWSCAVSQRQLQQKLCNFQKYFFFTTSQWVNGKSKTIFLLSIFWWKKISLFFVQLFNLFVILCGYSLDEWSRQNMF